VHRPGARSRRGRPGVLAPVLVLALVAVTWRAATEAAPPVHVERTLAPYVRVPGRAPAFAWPGEGDAAVEVQGVGEAIASPATQRPVAIASVAKVMTAYLTLRRHPLSSGASGFPITITPADVAEQRERTARGESTVPVRAGERLTEREALEALLVPSANNVAALLARHDPGGAGAFVARMNAAARSLGMRSTTYTDPSGFKDSTVSTAADQLLLARVAMRQPTFAAIVAEPSVELPVAGHVTNYDSLVGINGYVGVKTGSDRAAGGCFVFAKRFAVAGRPTTILGVVLGQREGPLVESALTSARLLADSVAASLRLATVLPAHTSVLEARSRDGRSATALTTHPISAIGWPGLRLALRVLASPAQPRPREGQRMAEVVLVGSGGGAIARGQAVADRSVGGPGLLWRLRHVL
jgi:serine-type D-Ala-D-Ala carboxypeptidase (penicillin-binding protein 5/6)